MKRHPSFGSGRIYAYKYGSEDHDLDNCMPNVATHRDCDTACVFPFAERTFITRRAVRVMCGDKKKHQSLFHFIFLCLRERLCLFRSIMRDGKNANPRVGVCGCISVCFRVRDKNAKKHYIICTYEWAFLKKGEHKNSDDTPDENVQ